MKPQRAILFGCLLLAAAGMTAGCPVVAWMAAVFAPPDPVPPKFELPRNKNILVLVDDPNHLVGFTDITSDMTDNINAALVAQNIAKTVIPRRRLLDYAAGQADFHRKSISEVGKALGADLVIYVKIDHFQLKDDPMSPVYHGMMQAGVRVVDVEEGKLWPRDRIGNYPAESVDRRPREGNASSQFEMKLARSMAVEMAENIAKLFYESQGRPHTDLPPADAHLEM